MTEHGEIAIDIYSKLANDRMLFINDAIDDRQATDIIATLLLKDSEDSSKKITLFLNSSGGDIRSVFMIYDVMSMISCPIETVCTGSALDEALILLTAGTKGMRFATNNCVIAANQLVHSAMYYSDLTNAKAMLDQSVKDNNRMMEILSKGTGKTKKQVSSDFDRRVFMDCKQALRYGLIDRIVPTNK